jgi:hypothetical protein
MTRFGSLGWWQETRLGSSADHFDLLTFPRNMAVSASDVRADLNLHTTSPDPTAAQKRNAKRDARVQRELAALIGPRGVPSLAVASGSRPASNVQRTGLKAKPRLGGGSVKWYVNYDYGMV